VGGESVVAVDTNGAGDMFAGACLAARLQGAEAIDAARFANRAAARVITQFGARLPSLTDYQLLPATE
jgi:sugar/nucleoside kinase (ribokinase family)